MKYEIDAKKRVVKIVPEREEDLYFIYLLVDVGDVVRGWTVREYRPEGAKEGERIKMFLGIRVEALEYHKFRGSLRIRGTVIEVQEGVEGVKGRRHTLEVVPGRELEIEKRDDVPLEAVTEVLNLAKAILPRVLLISVDDEEATIAYITSIGVEVLYTVANTTSRREGSSLFENYFQEIKKRVEEIRTRYRPDKVVAAGPGIVVERLVTLIPAEKALQNAGGLAGVFEFLRRGLYDELRREMGIEVYERILHRLATSRESVAIGPDEVEIAATSGRVESLLVLDTFIKENPKESWKVISLVYRSRGKVHIVKEETEVGEWLKKVGGVSALLRW